MVSEEAYADISEALSISNRRVLPTLTWHHRVCDGREHRGEVHLIAALGMAHELLEGEIHGEACMSGLIHCDEERTAHSLISV